MPSKIVPFLFFALFTFFPILVYVSICHASGQQQDALNNSNENGDDDDAALIRKGIAIIVNSDDNEQMDPESLSKAIELLENARKMIRNEQSQQQQHQTSDLHYLYYLGLAYFKISEFELYPTQYNTLEKATFVLQEGLDDSTTAAAETTATNLSIIDKVNFYRLLGRIYYNMRQKCEAANNAYLPWLELLEQQQKGRRRGRKENSQLARIPKGDRMLLVDSISNCDPSKGIKLWDEMLEGGDLSVDNKKSRTSSQILLGYAMMFAAHWRVGGLPAAQTLFDRLRLNETTPWRWPSQIPPQINTALLSKEQPEPWLDHQQFAVCRALEAHKTDIQSEFINYKRQLNLQQGSSAASIPDFFEHHHFDSALSLNHEWTHLYLKRSTPIEGIEGNVGWLESRCKSYFPKTCQALRGFSEVDGRLLHRGKGGDETTTTINDNNSIAKNCGNHGNQGYMSWCNQAGTLAGTVVFMTIPPKGSVHLHTGVSNQRLKCHLVITAPQIVDNGSNIGGAWIEVAGEKHLQETGMIFAWDDSFYHEVYNNGEDERVVLDVTFWHPDLVTDLHDQSTEQSKKTEL